MLRLVQFLKIYITQGSVATRVGCGGIFNNNISQIFNRVCQWKNFENPLRIDKVPDITLLYRFCLEDGVHCRVRCGSRCLLCCSVLERRLPRCSTSFYRRHSDKSCRTPLNRPRSWDADNTRNARTSREHLLISLLPAETTAVLFLSSSSSSSYHHHIFV